ncbi:hypothetical protein DASC09_019790 [Saccharomycopsis crataegensis]|uniref:Pro-apoptotic serine protease NMA111 n=1 Tax=Saccharomycopsis crataegensis TaxID=43959 RepID=A0AAV5QJ56_9ASCO|nr:hypothetical protein DASC09_019790 [Saccharomycopsis crataegensis]
MLDKFRSRDKQSFSEQELAYLRSQQSSQMGGGGMPPQGYGRNSFLQNNRTSFAASESSQGIPYRTNYNMLPPSSSGDSSADSSHMNEPNYNSPINSNFNESSVSLSTFNMPSLDSTSINDPRNSIYRGAGGSIAGGSVLDDMRSMYLPNGEEEEYEPGTPTSGDLNAVHFRDLAWQNVITKVAKSIVILKFTKVHNYDTEQTGIFKTLGFIVDDTSGLILTCKKIIGNGPIQIIAIFNNFEEVLVKPLYIDPTHDFMILKFDVSKIKFLKIQGLELSPNLVKLGCEFKIFSLNNNLNDYDHEENNLIVLNGFISRLDCNAPIYGSGQFLSYNDFNTEYMQALTYNAFKNDAKDKKDQFFLTCGSPVIDINGFVIALETASFINNNDTSTSTNFLLPLYRAQTILQDIQQHMETGSLFKQVPVKTYEEEDNFYDPNNPSPDDLNHNLAKQQGAQQSKPLNYQSRININRGTIQVQWVLKTFNECRKLGLQTLIESIAREKFPDINGLLVAKVVLPYGPAHSKVKEGDILISVNNFDICSLIQLEEILDNSIDMTISLVLQRNGENIKINLDVQDLFSITSLKFVQCCGATFNDISYNLARFFVLPLQGVFLNHSYGAFTDIGDDNVIVDNIDGFGIFNLNDLVNVIRRIPDYKKVPVSYRCIKNLNEQITKIITIDKHWFKALKIFQFNYKTGLWDYQDIGQTNYLPSIPIKPKVVRYNQSELASELGHLRNNSEILNVLRSFVKIEVNFPYSVDSFPNTIKRCYGLIIDNFNGYVLVSRYYIPHDLCDVTVIFNESAYLPAEVVFMHPFQNYVILKYDPSLVDFDPQFQSQTPNFNTNNVVYLRKHQKVLFVGFDNNFKLTVAETSIKDIKSSNNIQVNPYNPFYKCCNLELLKVDNQYVQNKCNFGVLCDPSSGKILGLWLRFSVFSSNQNVSLANTERPTIKFSVDHEASKRGKKANQPVDYSYSMGVDVLHIINIILHFQAVNKPPKVRILETEFNNISVLKARIKGLSDERIDFIEMKSHGYSSSKHQDHKATKLNFLEVSKMICSDYSIPPKIDTATGNVVEGANTDEGGSIVDSRQLMNYNTNQDLMSLQPGDILLSVNENLVNRIADLDLMYYSKYLNFKVVRKERELNFKVKTQEVTNTNHVLIWSGLVLHKPHLGVKQLIHCSMNGVSNNTSVGATTTKALTLAGGSGPNNALTDNNKHLHPGLPSGIFISDVNPGSPAELFGFEPNHFITHVNDIHTPDLDTFKKVIAKISIIQHKSTNLMMTSALKIRVVNMTNFPCILPVQPNYYYNPTIEFKKDTGSYQWVEHNYLDEKLFKFDRNRYEDFYSRM